MEFPRNSTQPTDDRPTVVTGTTLSEAFRKVRRDFGPEAVISGSRSRTMGWGKGQVVEVLVSTRGPGPLGQPGQEAPGSDLKDALTREVERVERLVLDFCREEEIQVQGGSGGPANPLVEYLVDNGASSGAVDRLLDRFAAETGQPRHDRPGVLTWLAGHLDTGPQRFEEWLGHHAFVPEHGADRLDFILDLSPRLQETGAKVLVVSILPDPDRDEPRLRNRAAASGFDAAVVREPGQLPAVKEQLSGYDCVFLDLPGMNDPRMDPGGHLHDWLGSSEKFHRHLLLPMDRDFRQLDGLREGARAWNCDWLVLFRFEQNRGSAKLLDLVERIPLPVSFLAEVGAGEAQVSCATPDKLLDGILGAEPSARFQTGVASDQS